MCLTLPHFADNRPVIPESYIRNHYRYFCGNNGMILPHSGISTETTPEDGSLSVPFSESEANIEPEQSRCRQNY
jgi:hypothetical protein